MTTESNANNYTSNISKTNLELMTENGSKEINSDEKARIDELTQPKKIYYLASCDENIDMLKKEQEQGLTDILLLLKKEHDNIKMESKKITDETERLEKKIKMIKQMDAKTDKKNFDSKVENENIKKAIEATKERLREEEYKNYIEKNKLENYEEESITEESMNIGNGIINDSFTQNNLDNLIKYNNNNNNNHNINNNKFNNNINNIITNNNSESINVELSFNKYGDKDDDDENEIFIKKNK